VPLQRPVQLDLQEVYFHGGREIPSVIRLPVGAFDRFADDSQMSLHHVYEIVLKVRRVLLSQQ